MYLVRLFLLLCLFSVVSALQISAEINSWVDENGVRHYSNVGTPDPNTVVESAEEYKFAPPPAAPRMTSREKYQQDAKRRHKQKRQEWEEQEKERQKKNKRRAAKREEKRNQQLCRKSKKRLEKLRQDTWINFSSRHGIHNCQNYNDHRQRRECERKERRLKQHDYRAAVKRAEDSINQTCGK